MRTQRLLLLQRPDSSARRGVELFEPTLLTERTARYQSALTPCPAQITVSGCAPRRQKGTPQQIMAVRNALFTQPLPFTPTRAVRHKEATRDCKNTERRDFNRNKYTAITAALDGRRATSTTPRPAAGTGPAPLRRSPGFESRTAPASSAGLEKYR